MESLLSLMFITEWCNRVQHCNIHLKLEKKYSNWWESQLKLSSMLGCSGYVSLWRKEPIQLANFIAEEILWNPSFL